MAELVFLKLGGSLLTDKRHPRALRGDVLQRLAYEIAAARADRPGLQLLLGHGSGSFGHYVASQYGIRAGVPSPLAWRGFAETARVAAELNRVVAEALADAGVPVLPLQPSASARCRDGELQELDERPLCVALANGLVPVVYGDVALDDLRGGTVISTEQIFRWLAPRLCPQRVIVAGEVAGVLTVDPMTGESGEVVEEITRGSLSALGEELGSSRGVDVTGGMFAKVSEMMALVQATPSLHAVQIISGLVPGLVREVLANPDMRVGTRISRAAT